MTATTVAAAGRTTSSTVLTDGTVPLRHRTATGAVLRPLGPFDLDRTRAFVSRWEPTSLIAPGAREPLRLTAVEDGTGEAIGFAVTQDAGGDVHVEVAGTDATERAVGQLARVLSLDHDARDLPDVGRRLPAIGALLARHPGLRPTLFGSPYEAAVWGVLSSRISTRQAAVVHARIAESHGRALELAGAVRHAFPGPAALLTVDEVPGLPAEKVRRLHGIAEAALAGVLDVDRLRALGPDDARAALRTLRGIGPFWASGIWLRACGVVDEFPVEETRAGAALARLHGRDPEADRSDLVAALHPYALWIALVLRWDA